LIPQKKPKDAIKRKKEVNPIGIINWFQRQKKSFATIHKEHQAQLKRLDRYEKKHGKYSYHNRPRSGTTRAKKPRKARKTKKQQR